MRLLAIDYGRRRVGIAISDPTGTISQPLCVVSREKALERILSVIREKDVKRVVIGLPINMDGTEGPMVEEVRSFGKLLEGTGIEVVYFDERLSSFEAEEVLRGMGLSSKRMRNRVDAVAAAIILQSYMERNRNAIGG